MATTSSTSTARMGRMMTSCAWANSSGAVAIGRRPLRKLLVNGAREFQVLPRLALIGRGTQEVGGMIRHDQRHRTEAMHLAAQSAERGVGAEQVLRRDA